MTRHRLVAIHQPNFFPWLGFFDKVARADILVLLDDAQFPKTGGTWLNRVRLMVNGRPQWATMPVMRAYHGVRRINEMEINNATPWRTKFLNTLQSTYGQAPCFDRAFPLLVELVENPTSSLADYNHHAIKRLVNALGLDVPDPTLSSTLNVESTATDRLIAIVQAVDGTAYLCGGGARSYQEDEKFAAAGIELVYQDFHHPVYPQGASGEFVPGLSIIDALMHCSFARTSEMIGTQRVRS